MIKKIVSVLIIMLVTLFASTVWTIRPDSFFASTVYTVAGIMFSIGLGLIVTFNPSGVKNPAYLKSIRRNISDVRDSFLIHFGLTTLYYITNQYVAKFERVINFKDFISLHFSASIFLCLLMIYSSIYFIVNFIELQKLNNDIFDVVNREG
ncbi:hypothetical protein C0557_10090 [Kosakonia sp. MUSA4]|nr:hypothetical protein C0557_10090 [Kosakonia sp. MUSA4]